MLYARKILKSQMSTSETGDIELNEEVSDTDPLTFKDILIVIVLFGGFGVYAYGTISYGWGTEYMSGIMLVIAIIAAMIAMIGPNAMVKSFISGCKGVVYACLITGFAAGISYILNEGRIIHTIVHFLALPLRYVGSVVSSYLMLGINGVTSEKTTAHMGGIVIGLTLTLVHLIGIPLTGTSVNPARSLSAAIFAGGEALSQVWVFLVAPLVGAAIAAHIYKVLMEKKA